MNTSSLPKNKTIQAWLTDTTRLLKTNGVGTARLDALILLEDATGYDRAYILAHQDITLDNKVLRTLKQQIKDRIRHIPLAYIRGTTEFYGRQFFINSDVLEPRPESESMITLLKALELSTNDWVADIGTGSGALAITAKLELPDITIVATDIDPLCLRVARRNAQQHLVKIPFYSGNLLEALGTPAHQKTLTLLCNLPYVPSTYQINQAAAMEPRHAIFGGEDGLDLYRILFDQIKVLDLRVSHILTESLPFQQQALRSIAKQYGYKEAKADNFIQLFSKIVA